MLSTSYQREKVPFYHLYRDELIGSSTAAIPQPLPMSQPTSATVLILRKSLSRIVGRVVHHFQKLDEPAKYSDVEQLNLELNEYTENLPPCFQMYQPDKSMDKSEFR